MFTSAWDIAMMYVSKYKICYGYIVIPIDGHSSSPFHYDRTVVPSPMARHWTITLSDNTYSIFNHIAAGHFYNDCNCPIFNKIMVNIPFAAPLYSFYTTPWLSHLLLQIFVFLCCHRSVDPFAMTKWMSHLL